MAKSLFASFPQHMAKASVLFEVQNDVSSTDDHLYVHKPGNIRGTFPEFNSAFSSQNHQKVNIGWNRSQIGCQSVDNHIFFFFF